jgi:hypothetical protein
MTNDDPDDARSIATRCLYSWTNGDFETTRKLVTDDVTFIGPLGTATEVDSVRAFFDPRALLST